MTKHICQDEHIARMGLGTGWIPCRSGSDPRPTAVAAGAAAGILGVAIFLIAANGNGMSVESAAPLSGVIMGVILGVILGVITGAGIGIGITIQMVRE